jgi:isoamylase
LTGSPDVYHGDEREPERSINFVACHDGFTLNDLVSYNGKHNETNRENNRDGSDSNLSWNCGVEGPTEDPEVERLRNRQVKNFLALTLLSVGTPMLLMGDEVRRTQGGNNNAYCQNNELSWFDWELVSRHADVLRFAKQLIAFRMMRDLPIERYGMTLSELLAQQLMEWHGTKLRAPDWGRDSHSLAGTLSFDEGRFFMHLMINAYWEPLAFEIPPLDAGFESWRRCLDTFLDAPDDICPWHDAVTIHTARYTVQPRAIAVLISKNASGVAPGARMRRGSSDKP